MKKTPVSKKKRDGSDFYQYNLNFSLKLSAPTESIQLILQPQIVGYHRNKLRIRGLSAVVLDGISKVAVQRIHISPIPRDLDCVPDGSFNS